MSNTVGNVADSGACYSQMSSFIFPYAKSVPTLSMNFSENQIWGPHSRHWSTPRAFHCAVWLEQNMLIILTIMTGDTMLLNCEILFKYVIWGVQILNACVL